MRHQSQQKILDQLTEKFDRTSRVEFFNRGNMIKQYKKRYVTINEFPHSDRPEGQLVLRYNGGKMPRLGSGLSKIIEERSAIGYHIHMHPNNERSVKTRPHFHLYPSPYGEGIIK